MPMFRLAVVCLLTSCLATQGCALVAVDHVERFRDGEGVFDGEWLDRITPGVTSHHHLMEQFGEPDRILQGPDNSLIATWEFIRQDQRRTGFLGLFRYSKTREERQYLHVVLRDDLVVRRWRDKAAEVNPERVFKAVGVREPAPIEESRGVLPNGNAVPEVAPVLVEDAPEPGRAPADVRSPLSEPSASEGGADAEFVRPL